MKCRIFFVGALMALGMSSAFADSANSWSGSSSESSSSGNITSVTSTPGLAASGGSQSCAGSASGGFSAFGFGISGGKTYEMEGCETRSDSLVLNALGYSNAGLLRMCQNPKVAVALAYDGHPCPPEYYNRSQRRMIFGDQPAVGQPQPRPSVSPRQLVTEGTKRTYNTDRNVWE